MSNILNFSGHVFKWRDTNQIISIKKGTTGMPKGVELTHRNLISNCEMIRQDVGGDTLIQETTDTFQDILPCVLPLYHCYGW